MLIARNIKKSFGKKRVLDDIDITLENGKITTIIGENGAGKSTIIGIISGFFFQDTGTVQKSTVSVMPDADSLFEDMTGKQFLKYILEIKKVDYKKAVTMAETFGIKNALNKKMCEYSFGMKKKISFIQAYIGDYDTYIFDEPTSGVDVPSAKKMMDLLLDLIKQGKAVLLTSHNIDELQNISDYVYILKKGQIFEEGTISEVINRNQTTDSYILETDYIDQVSSILIEQSITYRILDKNNLIEVLADLNVMNKLVLILLERNILIKGFTRKLNSLRDIAFEE